MGCGPAAEGEAAAGTAAPLTIAESTAAGADGQVQFNVGGQLAASPAFAFDGATGGVVVGANSTAGQGGRAIGSMSSATGAQSTAIGYGNNATQTYAVAIGAYNRSGAAASVAVGEFLTASGDNAVALGYATQATGTYSTAIGVGNGAAGDGSVALGQRSWATRAGEFTHSSGTPSAAGLHAIDMFGKSGANLVDVGGNELRLPAGSLASMRVRLMAAGDGKRAHEVHELLVASSWRADIESDERIAGSFDKLDWAVAFEGDAGNVLHIRVTAGSSARVFARVEWAEMGNL